MSESVRKVVRDEVTRSRTVVSVGPVDRNALGTFGWFISIRCRSGDQTKERRRWGTCVICRRAFLDDDPIHMVFDVVRNGKTVGNRLCCAGCAEQHGTIDFARSKSVSDE